MVQGLYLILRTIPRTDDRTCRAKGRGGAVHHLPFGMICPCSFFRPFFFFFVLFPNCLSRLIRQWTLYFRGTAIYCCTPPKFGAVSSWKAAVQHQSIHPSIHPSSHPTHMYRSAAFTVAQRPRRCAAWLPRPQIAETATTIYHHQPISVTTSPTDRRNKYWDRRSGTRQQG